MKRLDAKVNDMIRIGENISIKVESKTGQIARLSIIAPKETPIELVKAGQAISEFVELQNYGVKGLQ
jgi:sRNA-binding carbon storage regulator CsrA